MSNNNLADISAFESIQSEQHSRIGMSAMSIFNVDLKAMRAAGEDYVKAAQVLKKAREEYKKIGEAYKKFERLAYAEYARIAPDDPKAKEAKESDDIERYVAKNTDTI